jgi:valyl-tRNA synthetase
LNGPGPGEAESGGTIVGQLRRLGYSVDWQRERFTLDPGLNKAVVEAFLRLHEQGLIYRGEYLVNWCPASGSAVSDLEVEMKELEGHLRHFRYPLSDGSGHLVVATTRPETLLGDTAVAVNPSDGRYAALVGQTLSLPLVGRQIPIVADEHVDPAFGTGCVKVTPAHDPNDFAIGQRHGLPQITVMAKDGSMNAAAGRFAGLDRFEARKAVVAAMEAEGFLVKVEPHRHSVPFSDRGKVPVEPLLSTQWLRAHRPAGGPLPRRPRSPGAPLCARALEQGLPRLAHGHPRLVHQPPTLVGPPHSGLVCGERNRRPDHRCHPYVVARDEAEALARAREAFGATAVIEQDPDVLDTWFSSGLWPFSTLGWPDPGAADLATWYPTSGCW